MIRITNFREYFSSGKFWSDMAFEEHKFNLIKIADSFNRYEKRCHTKSNAKREELEKKLYEAAKSFVEDYERRIKEDFQ